MMRYEDLERLKTEADRWLACVAGDGSTLSVAVVELRSLFDRVNIAASLPPEVTAWIATSERGSVMHFSKADGWEVKAVGCEPQEQK